MCREKSLAIFLFYLLLFSYPLLSFFWRHDYPVFTIEVGLITLIVVMSGIFLTLVLCQVRQSIAVFLTALMICMVFIVQFNLQVAGVITCFFISLALTWRLKSQFYPYSLPIMMALIGGAFFDSVEQDGRIHPQLDSSRLSSELPSIVHIILDSFVGMDGLPDYPASEVIKDEVYRFFGDYNFKVFPAAYSRYAITGDSLYSALNFQNDGDSEFLLEHLEHLDLGGLRKHVMTSNAEFSALESLGYRFNIYQTEHIDFCQSNPEPIDRCWNYQHPNVASIQHARDPVVRVKMLMTVMLTQSRLTKQAIKGLVYDQGIAMHDPRVFLYLQDDLLQSSAGHVFFAHMLIPHGPFAFMHDCSVNYDSSPIIRYHWTGIEEEDPAIYEYRTMKYFEQMECALLSLRQLFDKMKKAGIFENSIIVIHSDHGYTVVPHTPVLSNINALTSEDYRVSFSVLFAVKFPNQAFEIDHRVLPLSFLLEEFTSAIVDNAVGENADWTFLQNLPADSDKLAPYVFLWGSHPMKRVDINIFENLPFPQ
ncbi:MAG: hypothetical protein O6928_10450 [Gammaproteobacteria bacterium]|nr:hypothetical protein [Gammaproteobacteria bacterium]